MNAHLNRKKLNRAKLVTTISWLGISAVALLATAVTRAATYAEINNGVSADLYRSDRELSSVDIGVKQTPLGDVIADAIRASAKTDAAFIQASAFSDTPVTLSRMGFALADILKTLEYKGNTIGIVKVTGEQIRGAMENSLYQYPSKNGAFLQTAGFVTNFNPSAPAGKRITSIKLNGTALDNSKTYRIAMSMTLANGASAYFKYWKKSDLEKDTNISLETALSNYLNEHKTIVKGEDRLVASSK